MVKADVVDLITVSPEAGGVGKKTYYDFKLENTKDERVLLSSKEISLQWGSYR